MSTTLFSLLTGIFYGYSFGTHALPYGVGATGLTLLFIMYIADSIKSYDDTLPWQHLLVMNYTLLASLGLMLTTDPLLLACSYSNIAIGIILLLSIRSLEQQHTRFWEDPLLFCVCYGTAWKNRLLAYTSAKQMPALNQSQAFSLQQTLIILTLLSSMAFLSVTSWLTALFFSCVFYHSLSTTTTIGSRSTIHPRPYSTRVPLFFTILILSFSLLTESHFSTSEELLVNPLHWGSFLLLLLIAAFTLYRPEKSIGKHLHKNTLLAIHLVLAIFLFQQLLTYGTHLHRVIAFLFCLSYVFYRSLQKIDYIATAAPTLSILIPCTLISILACTPLNEFLMSTLPPKRMEDNKLVLDMNYILTYNYDNYEQWNPIILDLAHGSLSLDSMKLIDCYCKTNFVKLHHHRLINRFRRDDSIERYNIAETRAAYWLSGNHKLLKQAYKNIEQSCTQL